MKISSTSCEFDNFIIQNFIYYQYPKNYEKIILKIDKFEEFNSIITTSSFNLNLCNLFIGASIQKEFSNQNCFNDFQLSLIKKNNLIFNFQDKCYFSSYSSNINGNKIMLKIN